MLSNQLSTTKLKPIMSAIIAMNKDIEAAIKEMCADAVLQATSALSEKYGFDEEEAKEFLKIKDIKIIRGRASTSKSEAKKAKKAKKEKNEKPKTKRGMSGYNLYNREERATVVAEMEKIGKEFTSKDVMSVLGPRWKALTDDEKKEWSVKAKALNVLESSSEEENVEEENVEEDEE